MNKHSGSFCITSW